MAHISKQATASANSNIAFIKYWGNSDDSLRLPVNSSLSMNLDNVFTETSVMWDGTLTNDVLILNGLETKGSPLERVSSHLDFIRRRTGVGAFAKVESSNNFPMGAGIASSASSFAALTVASVAASEVEITERELTTIARLGSGSAARSIPDGFVEWHRGSSHEESFAESIAPADYWDLVDVIAIVSSEHKTVGSTQGHPSAKTSDLQNARVAGAEKRLALCKEAILAHDFKTFSEVVQYDSNLMHAVMMTSRPPLFYWKPGTLTVMEHIRLWRAEGLDVCYTLDAGPNVHCICLRDCAKIVSDRLKSLSDIQDIVLANVGSGAVILTQGVSNS